MVPYDIQDTVAIPATLFSAAPGNERRRARSAGSRESFDLRELVAESSRRGSVLKVSVAGLEASNKNVLSADQSTKPRITRGSRCYQSNSIGESSQAGVACINFAALDCLSQIIDGRPSGPPANEDEWTHIDQWPPVSKIHQTLGSFRFPPAAATVSSDPDVALQIGPFEVPSHPEGSYQPKSRQASKHTIANALRRFSVIPSLLTPNRSRHSTLHNLFEQAKKVEKKIHRSLICQRIFEYCFYSALLAALYFILVGVPLWKGLIWCIYIFLSSQKFVIEGGFIIFVGTAFMYSFAPLLIKFEHDPIQNEPSTEEIQPDFRPGVETCSLLIPCYKSESLIAATLEAALKIFPAKNIFIIANGNSLTPLDNTADVCERYGVNHIWCPIGSKIIAQFLGSYAAKDFPYTLLIDDDCLLPPDFPIVTDRMKGRIMCLGYTIKSVGPGRLPGTLCQQAQDIEYKLSGIQRAFAGKVGSATFPHGAIALWDRELLIKTFQCHPGFSISEDWFFGHVARTLGSRIIMCTQIFVETETPPAIFWVSGGKARGGFGEMTIYKQRFHRWNFFFVNDIYWNMRYILCSWKLGWWEVGAKIFVWQEVYETVIFLLTPFIFPISLYIRPQFCAILFAGTFAMYFVNVIIFNEVHLRWKGEMVSWSAILYYMPYKIILFVVNVASCYNSIFKYAKYFAKRHPKVVHDTKVIEVILNFVEQPDEKNEHQHHSNAGNVVGINPSTTMM